jgi:hypothetical protein
MTELRTVICKHQRIEGGGLRFGIPCYLAGESPGNQRSLMILYRDEYCTAVLIPNPLQRR